MDPLGYLFIFFLVILPLGSITMSSGEVLGGA